MAILPLAPGRLSMMNCWPSRSDSQWPMRRALMSFSPPGAKPTTMRTGRVGKSSASNHTDLHCQRAANLHIGSKSKSARLSKSPPMVDARLPTPWAKRYPAVRVGPEMLEKIDRWAVRENVSRSEAIRTFVRWALDDDQRDAYGSASAISIEGRNNRFGSRRKFRRSSAAVATSREGHRSRSEESWPRHLLFVGML
jgi:Arc/MetJ-type ribon-helix-helix transcriptional regulator